ncbi:MAG: ribbon-helix-helix protein, CopG family [Acidobacteriia bacterium]|nr:ribbon-helix-helix protein, CopG family [Terriglobia bacterium]
MKPRRRRERREVQAETTASVRASVSFPPELYRTLEEIAKQKKVSLAWVVRDAAEKYITDKWPLLVKEQQSS